MPPKKQVAKDSIPVLPRRSRRIAQSVPTESDLSDELKTKKDRFLCRGNSPSTSEQSSLGAIAQCSNSENLTVKTLKVHIKAMEMPVLQSTREEDKPDSVKNTNRMDENVTPQEKESQGVSDVFKPRNVRYSFEEPMEVDVTMFQTNSDSEGKTDVAGKLANISSIVVTSSEDEEHSTLNRVKLSPKIKLSHKLARRSPRPLHLIPHKLTFNTPPDTQHASKKIENEIIEISDEHSTPDLSASKDDTTKFLQTRSVISETSVNSDDNAKDNKNTTSTSSSVSFVYSANSENRYKTNDNSEDKNSVTPNDDFIPTSKFEASQDYEFEVPSEDEVFESETEPEGEKLNVSFKNLFNGKEQPAEEKQVKETVMLKEQSHEDNEKTEEQILMENDVSEGICDTINEEIGKTAKPEETDTSDIEETNLGEKSSENTEKHTGNSWLNELTVTESMNVVHQEITNFSPETKRCSLQDKSFDRGEITEETAIEVAETVALIENSSENEKTNDKPAVNDEISLPSENHISGEKFSENEESKQDQHTKQPASFLKNKDNEITDVQISLPEVESGDCSNKVIVQKRRRVKPIWYFTSVHEVLFKKNEINEEKVHESLTNNITNASETGNELKVMIKEKGSKRKLENGFEEAPQNKKICMGPAKDDMNNNNPKPKKIKRIRPTTIITDNVDGLWYVDFDPDIRLSTDNPEDLVFIVH